MLFLVEHSFSRYLASSGTCIRNDACSCPCISPRNIKLCNVSEVNNGEKWQYIKVVNFLFLTIYYPLKKKVLGCRAAGCFKQYNRLHEKNLKIDIQKILPSFSWIEMTACLQFTVDIIREVHFNLFTCKAQ
jgi:hypothetical protein